MGGLQPGADGAACGCRHRRAAPGCELGSTAAHPDRSRAGRYWLGHGTGRHDAAADRGEAADCAGTTIREAA